MTPEEKFDNKIQEILQKIKEEMLFSGNKQNVLWKSEECNLSFGENAPFSFEKGEEVILRNFEELRAIKMEEYYTETTSYSKPLDIPNFHKWKNLSLRILQPKFDEVYKEWVLDKKTSDKLALQKKSYKKLFLTEKNGLKSIEVGSEHRAIRDKWLNIKRVLDAIYGKISPLKGNEQEIGISVDDFRKKELDDNKFISDTLEQFVKIGIISELKKPKLSDDNIYLIKNGVFFNESVAIIIKDVQSFKNYHSQLQELYDFIEKDGERRFSTVYSSKTKVEILHKTHYWTIAKIKLYWALNNRQETYIPRNKIEFNYESENYDLLKELKKLSRLFRITISLNKTELNELIRETSGLYNRWSEELSKIKDVDKAIAQQKKRELNELEILNNKKVFEFESHNYLITRAFENDYGYSTIWDGLVFTPQVNNAFDKINNEFNNFLQTVSHHSVMINIYKHKILNFTSNEKEGLFKEIFGENYFSENEQEINEALVAFLILEKDKKIKVNNFYCSFYVGGDLKDIIVDFKNSKKQEQETSQAKTDNNIKRQIAVNIVEKDWLIHGKLKFNKITGDFQLGKVKGNFPPNIQEYTLLLTLLESEYRQSDYLTLLKAIMPEKNIEKGNIKSKKIQLGIVIRNIKYKMKILPKKKIINKDIFKVMKGFGGYRLIE